MNMPSLCSRIKQIRASQEVLSLRTQAHTERKKKKPTWTVMKQQEKEEHVCFLVFLHPGAEVRLGWLMWKAWWRGSERRVSCPSGGVSAGSEWRRVWGRFSSTNPVTQPSSSQTSSASLLTLQIHPENYTWWGWEFRFHTLWCENYTSAHKWWWVLESASAMTDNSDF